MIRNTAGRFAASLLLASLLLPSASSSAATDPPPPIDLTEYLSRLEQAKEIVSAARDDSGAADITAARDALGYPLSVQLPDGNTVRIPEDPVLEGLAEGDAVDLQAAEREIDVLTRYAREIQVAADEGLSEKLQDAVSSPTTPETLDREVGAEPDAAERLGDGIGAFFRGLGRALAWPFEALGALGGALVWLIVLAVVALLVATAFRWMRKFAPTDQPEDNEDGSTAETSIPKAVDKIQAAVDAGDLRLAVRIAYRVLVIRIARRGFVRDAKTATAGECRDAIGANLPDAYPSVADATRGFERVAFGGTEPSLAAVRSLRDAELTVSRS